MERYILQILKENNRVIVPDFGAFIVKQRTPLTIVFNEFLQYNDGMLTEFIAREDGISKDDAKEKIETFIKKVNKDLQQDNPYNLGELGIITRSPAGKISVAQAKAAEKQANPAAKTSPEAPPAPKKADAKENREPAKTDEKIKSEAVTSPVKKEAEEEPKPAAQKTTPKTEEKKETPKAASQKKEPEPETPKAAESKPAPKPEEKKEEPVNKKEEPNKEKAKAAPKPPVTSGSGTTTEKSSEPLRKTEPGKKAEAEKKPDPVKQTSSQGYTNSNYSSRSNTTYKEQVNKQKRGLIILWIILIIAVNGLIILYFLNKKQVNEFVTERIENFRKSEPEEQEMLVPEGVATTEQEGEATLDELHPEELTPEEAEVSTSSAGKSVPASQTTYSSGPVYYVVAGVFSIESNADNLVADLRNLGYDAEKFGKIGTSYAVSYGGFNSQEEANDLLRQIKVNHNTGAWIKEVK